MSSVVKLVLKHPLPFLSFSLLELLLAKFQAGSRGVDDNPSAKRIKNHNHRSRKEPLEECVIFLCCWAVSVLSRAELVFDKKKSCIPKIKMIKKL